MTNILKNIIFLINSSWIIFSEISMYFIFKDKEAFIKNITFKLSKINILYVKIFQAIALNNNFIDEKSNNYFLKYTDNAPYVTSDIDYKTLFKLIKEYNLKMENNYSPINSGMISLVFKATKLDTNETIIIKMKRNNIEAKLEEAINKLMFIVYLLSYVHIIQRYEIPATITKNIGIVKAQTDFNQEIKNMRLIKNNCKRLNYIVIPEVYQEVTEKYDNIIFMDFLNGQKIDQISKEDYYEFAIRLNKFVFITLLIHGVTHGDLHSGNVLFIKDTNEANKTNDTDNIKIGLIDFGILYQTSKKFNEVLFDFCTEIFTKPAEDVAIRILKNGFFEPHDIFEKITILEREVLIKLISNFINTILIDTKNANQKKIYEFLFNLNNFVIENKLEKYGLRLSDEFIKLQMFIAMYQGISLKLTNNDYMEVVNKVVNDLYISTISLLEN